MSEPARMGATIRQVFEKRFSVRRMCQNYVEIYQRLRNGEPYLTAPELGSSVA